MSNEDITVKLHADIGEFTTNMEKAKGALNDFNNAASASGSGGKSLMDNMKDPTWIKDWIGNLKDLSSIFDGFERSTKTVTTSATMIGESSSKVREFSESAGSFEHFRASFEGLSDSMGAVGTSTGALSNAGDSLNDCSVAFDSVKRSSESLHTVESSSKSFGQLNSVTKEVATTSKGLPAVLGTVSEGIGNLMRPVTGMIAPLMAMQVSFAGIAIPILPLILIIGALVAIFLYLWTTNEGFRKAVIGIWNSISAVIGQVAVIIQTVISGLISFIVTAFQTFAGIVGPIIEVAFQNIQAIITTATGLISGIISTFTGLLSTDWGKAWDGIKQTIDTIWSGITGIVTTSVGTLNGLIDGFVGTAVEGLNWLIDVWNMVPGAPHIDKLQKPGSGEQPKPFAEGGIVTSPTLALIGERGPEAVVPLGRGFGGGIKNEVVVNVTYNNYAPHSESDEDKTVKVIRKAVNSGLRDSGIATGA